HALARKIPPPLRGTSFAFKGGFCGLRFALLKPPLKAKGEKNCRSNSWGNFIARAISRLPACTFLRKNHCNRLKALKDQKS
ncbi:MAG: hypothetical protein FWH26_09535, partial [Oscillospiraceae bacterium]|nr:hypothetical protein [Oscillospiraceae bacterium]